MDRYERILTLHRILKASRYPVPLTRLRDELGCSRATMYRDIAFLRDALGSGFLDVFLAIKRQEAGKFAALVSDRDYEWYLDTA